MNSFEYERLISGMSVTLTNDTILRESGLISFGKKNLWKGVSGVSYQIDVSVSNGTQVLLIECKCWKARIKLDTFWAFFGKVKDISKNMEQATCHGVLVTSNGWQSGVEELSRYYSKDISLYRITEMKEITRIVHTHFVEPFSIASAESFGIPRIIQQPRKA